MEPIDIRAAQLVSDATLAMSSARLFRWFSSTPTLVLRYLLAAVVSGATLGIWLDVLLWSNVANEARRQETGGRMGELFALTGPSGVQLS